MSTGILITARLGSTRLKRKHLLEVLEKPILTYLLKRIQFEFMPEIKDGNIKIIITTSTEKENEAFEQFSSQGIEVFYGSNNNIPLRHLQALRKFDLDQAISVDGDDILCSVAGMRCVLNKLVKGAPYVKTVNLPFGMNSGGYSRYFLESSLRDHEQDILETGWGRIFDTGKAVEVKMTVLAEEELLRFTLDYQEDYSFFKQLIMDFGDRIYQVNDKQIVAHVLKNNLYEITEAIAREYWDNFYKNMEAEKKAGI